MGRRATRTSWSGSARDGSDGDVRRRRRRGTAALVRDRRQQTTDTHRTTRDVVAVRASAHHAGHAGVQARSSEPGSPISRGAEHQGASDNNRRNWPVEKHSNPVYTIQPVVKSVEQPATSCKQTFYQLFNRFDSRLYRVNRVLLNENLCKQCDCCDCNVDCAGLRLLAFYLLNYLRCMYDPDLTAEPCRPAKHTAQPLLTTAEH